MPDHSRAAVLQHLLQNGVTLQALMDIDPGELDQLYLHACHAFGQQDYASAYKWLTLLTRLSHWQFDYWLALGQTCMRLDRLEEAVHSFSQAAPLRLDDPRPPALSGECLLRRQQFDAAAEAYQAALSCCADRSEHRALRQHIEQALRACASSKETST
ncbi:SycD/LcrH family type III secretion system chaperone VcrH [Paludibacterium sp. THUN1379]|uniref:hypothetical protein n=1 Tax=Paludibacterium sp. THUN1379 TaxID=3112107 RepID=UPI003087E84B|nr:SycD/LcrH family type III secretion system chaperone VcrH [Paludibacterium sp. THUN1379]